MINSKHSATQAGEYLATVFQLAFLVCAAILLPPCGVCQQPAGALDAVLGPASNVQSKPAGVPEADFEPTEPVQDSAREPAVAVFTKPQRAPPSAEEITAAESRIRDLFEEDIRSVGGGQRRVQVVRQLISAANDEKSSDADTYALLQLAVQLAEDGEDVDLVAVAAEAFATGFTGVDVDNRLVTFLGKQERQKTKPTAPHVQAALNAAERLLERLRFADAVNAAKLAKRLADKMVPARAADLRGRVEQSVADSTALANFSAAAAAAQDRLKRNPDDAQARQAVGLLAVWQGDWQMACSLLKKCGRPDLEAAAGAEPGENSGPDELCKAAGLWWKATTASGIDEHESLIAPVRRRIREHAADLYARALADGLQGSLSRKEAEKRITELRPKAAPAQRPVAGFVLPEATSPVFDRFAFERLEAERDEAWDDFQRAARRMPFSQYDYATAVRALVEIRPKWCSALAPTVRDASLEDRRAAIGQVLNQNPRFGDGHLCDCYLSILAGDEAKAKASLDTAFKLINDQSAEQVFCARQILDLACAAVMVDELETAKRINNAILKKKFPNEPAVLQVQAMLYMAQERPQLSEAIDKLNEALAKTKGEERGWVAASLAWVRAAAPLDTKLRLPQDAEKLADEALELLAGRSWRAWRAKAELRASEKNWAAAIACLERAESQAPLLYQAEFNRQRDCYRSNRSYEIERGK
jgi:hypothetical protein